MRLQPLSFHIAAGLALPLLPLAAMAQAPHYTAKDAVRAEWMRTPPAFTADERAKLPTADRARLELSLKRIGRPGTEDLLPTELAHPTQGQWDQRAEEARTPRERFDALFFLNRLKDKDALKALKGLKPEDARTWPKHLHLEAQVATARLNGGEVSAELQAFLDALIKAKKIDPVRYLTGRVRLVIAGKEKDLKWKVEATPGAVLSVLDAWNRGPWDQRQESHLAIGEFVRGGGLDGWDDSKAPQPRCIVSLPAPGSWSTAFFDQLGFVLPWNAPFGVWKRSTLGWEQRLLEGLPLSAPDSASAWAVAALDSKRPALLRAAGAASLEKFQPALVQLVGAKAALDPEPTVLAALLPSLRKTDPPAADTLRGSMLSGQSPIARAAAIEDLPAPPADLEALTKRTWADDQFESQQTLIQSYVRWKMAPEEQKAMLRPWLQHPNWSCRFEAYQALVKMDPSTSWPEAPQPTATEEKLLKEAERLAQLHKPVRLRITFSGHRQVTMRLDPTVAPINVANLELLAKKRFFDGHLVPRVVPDFVVQMGSPFDTMDGGPGYTVRCEDSLNWYGPGSVGMALAGKDTGGCQFFITTNATPHLTGKYTRVGEVEDLDHAMKILDDLELGARIESIRVVP